MHNLRLKIKSVDGPGLPLVTLQHPEAALGSNLSPSCRACVTTVEITDVPEDTPAAEVVRLYTHTTDLGFLRPPETRTWKVPFATLGVGRIIS
jgi:hypothetical protein